MNDSKLFSTGQQNWIQEHGLQTITRHDKTFSSIEYKIKQSLHSTSVNVLRIYALKSSEESKKFKQSFGESNIVRVWVDMHSLDEKNSIEKIIERGFQIPENGLRVIHGRLNLSNESVNTSLQSSSELKRKS